MSYNSRDQQNQLNRPSSSRSTTPSGNRYPSFSAPSTSLNGFSTIRPGLNHRQDSLSNMYQRSGPSSSTSSPQAQSVVYSTEPEEVNSINFEEHQRIFEDKSSRLLSYLGGTIDLVDRLQELNRSEWPFKYPMQTNMSSDNDNLRGVSADNVNSAGLPNLSRATRSQSVSTLVASSSTHNSESVAQTESSSNESGKLDILRLDVRLDNRSNVRVVDSLEHNSISNLFEDRLEHCLSYLNKLVARISDKSSKVLVTGDLNSGKSTFVNALLKRRVMPSDQQPCTMLFCEVLAIEENNGIEEAHAIPSAAHYNRKDESSYDRVPLSDLFRVVSEDFRGYELVKVYCHDKESTETMLNNGTLDINLIDSPGLNRDSLKTTQLFARQEEIDVVVFCVHAENQFTLSGQEFLQSAGKEKAYIFIVVNRFDTIRDKNRCRRQILDQIKNLSPRTYEDAHDLVHFVAADDCFPYDGDYAFPPNEIPSDFQRLEGCLRSFILEKRARSKLAPAKRFALNVLSDILTLANYNLDAADLQASEITNTLSTIVPEFERTIKDKEASIKEAANLSEKAVEYAKLEVERSLELYISNLGEYISTPSWPGFVGAMSYIEDLKSWAGQSIMSHLGDSERRIAESSTITYKNIISLDPQFNSKTNTLPQCPIKCNKDQSIYKAMSKIDMTWFELFDINTKLKGLSVGFSALTFVGTQLLGTKEYFFMTYQLIVDPTSNINTWLILGLSATGLGVAYFALNDLQKTCTKKILNKVQIELKANRFSIKASERVGNNTSRYLQQATNQLYSAYTSRIRDQEDAKMAHLQLQQTIGSAQLGFAKLAKDAQKLSNRILKVSTEDIPLSTNLLSSSL